MNCHPLHFLLFLNQSLIVLFLNGRFQWLTGFLEYPRKWKDSTEQRPANFTQSARSKMFIAWQSYEGFQITVNAVIDNCKFLLQEGMEYVLTERFCLDPADEYFGSQRKLRRRNDNPDIRTFGYNDNTIRVQTTISCQSGNTRGRQDKRRAWEQVTNDQLPCKKKRN